MKSSGTYNRADPTCFEKGEMKFSYKGKKFLIRYNDCTWGVEITIYKMVCKYPQFENDSSCPDHFLYREEKIAGFYISRERGFEKGRGFYNYEVVVLRQKGLKGMPGLLGRAFRQCLKPDFISLKEQMFMKEMENDWGLMKEYV